MKKIIIFVVITVIYMTVPACKNQYDNEKMTEETASVGEMVSETTTIVKEESTAKEEESTTVDWFWREEKYAYIIKPEDEKVFSCDIDNDNELEKVVIYAKYPKDPNNFPETMLKIVDGKKTIFETGNLFTGLSAERESYMFFMINEDNKNYLLEYCDTSHMGSDVRTYRKIEFFSDGNYKVVNEGKSDLSTNPPHIFNTTTDVDDAVSLFQVVMSYLQDKKTILLFDLDYWFDDIVYSTDENIKYASDRIEKNIFEGTVDYEGDDVKVFRELIYKYCESWEKVQ